MLNYSTKRPTALVREGNIHRIWVPQTSIGVRDGVYERSVTFLDEERNKLEHGTIHTMDQGAFTETHLVTTDTDVNVQVLQGSAYFLAIKYPVNDKRNPGKYLLECASFNAADQDVLQPSFRRGLLFTWIATSPDTDILTIIKENRKNKYSTQIPFGESRVGKIDIPEGYWKHVQELSNIRKLTD